MQLRCTALLFDLDGVLVDSRAVVERTWRLWAARHQLDVEGVLRVVHGRRSRETVREVAPHLDLDAEVAWVDATEVANSDGLRAVPGAQRLVSTLPADTWAVVTSGGQTLARSRLEAAGIPAPRLLISSDDVVNGKPAPDGYLLAAERLGRAPATCLVFEDAPPGIAAARAAGARVVALTTTHAADRLQGAVAMIPDLTLLPVAAAERRTTKTRRRRWRRTPRRRSRPTAW